MKKERTSRRQNKIISVASKRQKSLALILENIHDPHNVSAIFRTCDAVGVQEVSLIYNYEKLPKLGKKSSASAYKWVEKKKYKSVKECYENFNKKGFTRYYPFTLRDKSFIIRIFDIDEKYYLPSFEIFYEGTFENSEIGFQIIPGVKEILKSKEAKKITFLNPSIYSTYP